MVPITDPKPKVDKSSAQATIANSKVDPAANTKGMMGDDLDLPALRIYLAGVLKLKLDDQITDVVVNRTINGASTLTVSLDDYDRSVLRSGLLSGNPGNPFAGWLDVNVDGLWWRLVQVRKDDGDMLDLIFETREIAILRLYDQVLVMTGLTRAEFILHLIREPAPQLQIPVIIPELHTIQPQVTTANSTKTVAQMQDPQVSSDQPYTTSAPRTNEKTAFIMAIGEQESGNDYNSVNRDSGALGKYQIMPANIPSWSKEALGFEITPAQFLASPAYQEAIAQYMLGKYYDLYGAAGAAAMWYSGQSDPTLLTRDKPTIPEYVASVLKRMNALLNSPDAIIPPQVGPSATFPPAPDLGIVGGTRIVTPKTGSDFTFYRGTPQDGGKDWALENSWDCITRLAGEVNWYAFFVGGTFWYVDGETLLTNKPIMSIDESSRGVASIAFDYDRGKKSAEVTLTCRIGRWLAPPGAVVLLNHMGPVNGRWVVTDFTRSLMDLTATITLKKPMPELPEPPSEKGVQQPVTPGTSGPSVVQTAKPTGKKWVPPKKCTAGAMTQLTGFPNLIAMPQADPYHVDVRVLNALQGCAEKFGVKVTINSGYRDGTEGVGFSNDPHQRGTAIDAQIGNQYIGDYAGGAFADCLRSNGMEVGDTPGFWPSADNSDPQGRDPMHVQIPGSGVDKTMYAESWLGCPPP